MARGTLRIYLGAAPGVGKTFAMLDEGRRSLSRGTDVVVGFVETHGRPRTEAQLAGLEIVPRRTVEYRGRVFEEMDLDGVLARRPAVVLVDELAHTNVPGSRNEKRWKDVEELLTAGIRVISTVNVQHLESLNDVVERITGVVQRETLPDRVVRAADQLELVDMSPEALRRRMAHGNVYAADKVDTALANYFRVGNLAALRELALLWVADTVEESLHDYRARHGIDDAWETKERVLVALTGSPGGERLVRRAARMAMRTKAELVGVHIQSGDGLTVAPSATLQQHRELLEGLGGTYQEVVGADIAEALVQVARVENATQLVLGASRRSRWAEVTRASVINSVLRASGGRLDVHVISTGPGESADGQATPLLSPSRLRLAPLSRRRQQAASALAVTGLPVMTAVLTTWRETVGLQNALLCYLLLVVAVATIGGLWPAGITAVAAFVLLNYYFTAPLHTLAIDRGRDVFALVVFLVVAGTISGLVDSAARRRNEAQRARVEARALTRMAGLVLREDHPLPELVSQLVSAFQLDGAAVLQVTKTGWASEASAGPRPPRSPAEGTLSVPVSEGVSLVVSGPDLRGDDREVLDGFATQLRVAREGRRLQVEAGTATALAKANELRTALLAAVSHDLRTPLASIKASATSLLADDVAWSPAATRGLLETVDAEADRLNTLVGNLLDMSRLQTGAVVVQARPVALEEVVAAALHSLAAPSSVKVDVPETLPLVLADPALLERVVANLVDNALTYTPADRPVRVEAAALRDEVHLRVVDQGPGIPSDQQEHVFQAFQRLGDSPNGSGVGLGLAVARGFVEAMAGEIIPEGTPGGGCTMVVTLPVVAP